jgi:hypothetical protein
MKLLQRVKQSLMGAPVILFFIGLLFFGAGAGLTYQQILFRQDAIEVHGVVIGLSENCDDGCTYSPVVRFTTLTGESVVYYSNFSSYPPEYEVGEVVPILYKSGNPQKAIIAGEGGVLRFIFMGAGGAIILAGLVFFGINLRNSYLSEG